MNLPPQLSELIPVETLRRVLEAFSAATGHVAVICDSTGRVSLAPEGFDRDPLSPAAPEAYVAADGVCVASVRLATGVLAGGLDCQADPADAEALAHALAELLSHLCEQSSRLRDRTDELTALSHLSTLLSGRREPQVVLDTVTRTVAELMGIKAASIRLIHGEGQELRVVSAFNFSDQYLNKGQILLSRSVIDQKALNGEVVYVEDMATDPHVLYPEDAHREGLASMLCTGMVYRGKPMGVLRVYTAEWRPFSTAEVNVLRGIAQLAAAFTRNAQLDAESREQQRIQNQVELAADVQRRLLPASPPNIPPFEVFGRYEPCFELSGDFYDFIPFAGGMGVVVGDVVGKGVAAGLLMAAVRASLRAHVEDIYDIDQVMSKVNTALARDTRDGEFATVFYGTLNVETRRLTYCSAGHEPALLLRGGEFIDLDVGGMPVGIDATQRYEKGLIDLLAGDVLLLYTDGVSDTFDFEGRKFGRQRIRQAVLDSAAGTARDIVNHVLWETRRYVGLNTSLDDMTLVAIKVR